jgi:hypothetical protein
MSTLSPADRVMIAVTHVYQEHDGDPPARAVAAAVLAAAADQVVPEETWLGTEEPCYAYYRQRCNTRRDLLAIAAELGTLK